MGSTAQIGQDAPHSQLYGVTTLITASIVTLVVCIAIIGRWGTFHWWHKVMAPILLISLVAPLISELFKRKTWEERLESIGASNLYLGYIWLMLGTLLFADV